MDIISARCPDNELVSPMQAPLPIANVAKTAISARKTPTFPATNASSGIGVPVLKSENKPVYDARGKLVRQHIRIANARFADDSPQSLSFSLDHSLAGVSKTSRGIFAEHRCSRDLLTAYRAECPKLKGPLIVDHEDSCCYHCTLVNAPDIAQTLSTSEDHCAERDFRVFLLPKFDCEVNVIE
ncbi:unnamed protein product [Peniophora sp. CBMAI 1063]|nr:unnamed protein product [Peniophora sp. CBMAI 1063]